MTMATGELHISMKRTYSAQRDVVLNSSFQRISKEENGASGHGARLKEFCKQGRIKEAVQLLLSMAHNSLLQYSDACFLLQGCIYTRDIARGKQIHAFTARSLMEQNTVLCNTFMSLYAKCGRIGDAHYIFDTMPARNIFSWTMIISWCSQHGRGKEAFKIFKEMQEFGEKANEVTFVSVLSACAADAALENGKLVHANVLTSQCGSHLFVGSTLVDMYAKCGSIGDACQVFARMPIHDVVSWNSIIAGYTHLDAGKWAIGIFQEMQWENVKPSKITFTSALSACADLVILSNGKHVHSMLLKSGCEADTVVRNALIDMYARCGDMQNAFQTYESIRMPDIVTWSTIIAGYSQHGSGIEALKMFQQMQDQSVKPNGVTFISVLGACTSICSLELGKWVHAAILRNGDPSSVLLNTVIDMYGKCGSVQNADQVFDRLHQREAVSWNVVIAGHSQCGDKGALNLFREMHQEDVEPNDVTFVAIFSICAAHFRLEEGKWIYSGVLKSGRHVDVYVNNTILSMFCKCVALDQGCQIFDSLLFQDVVSWSVLILGYVDSGKEEDALQLFKNMQQDFVKPNEVTYCSALKACALMLYFEQGKWIHAHMLRIGCITDANVCNSLVDVYTRCGSIEDAQLVFRRMPVEDAVTWNTIIAGCAQNGNHRKALELFCEMQLGGVEPDNYTFVNVISSCGATSFVEQGKFVHAHVLKSGDKFDSFLANTLVDMYAKCGRMHDAFHIFSSLPEQDVVPWSAMITGYVVQNNGQEALLMFQKMQEKQVQPNAVTFISVLSGCAMTSALEQGRHCHDEISRMGLDSDTIIGNALVNMYAKCGSIVDAFQIFSTMPMKNFISWNAIIGAYAQLGCGKECIQLFKKMQGDGTKPDSSTLLSILSACSHAQLLDEGGHYFGLLSQFHITRGVHHFACMVDLFGRAGYLDVAEELIHITVFDCSTEILRSLLCACRIHQNVEMAERLMGYVLENESLDGAAFVLLSNIFAEVCGDQRIKVQKSYA